MPNPLTNRFSASNDLPPGSPDYARGPLANPGVPTPAVTTTPVPQSMNDRAAAMLQRAHDGMSALLGRPVTGPAGVQLAELGSPERQRQIDAAQQTLQARSSPVTPNILATVPRLAPLITQPAPPVGTPVSAPMPHSLDGWLTAQNAKGN